MPNMLTRTPGGANSGHSIKAGPAQNVEEDGLGLVVGGMTRQNIVREGLITGLAGSGLKIGTLTNLYSDCLKLSAHGLCRRTNNVGLGGRLGA
jgi:hypothetical protein